MNPLAQWFTWEGAPCQVGTRSVKLTGLSSKSTCNNLLHLEFRVHFWLVYSCVQLAVPVLIGKLLGGSFIPIGELSQN